MLDVAAPVLQSSVPGAVVDSVDVPLQLLTTVTAGAAGVVLGAAVPLPDALVQPSTVWVTEYAPALVTVMLGVAAPVLHSKVPAAVVDKVDDPQSLTTVTTGAAGVVFGAAVPLPDALVQPLTVWVTVYVPALVTVMLGVTAPVLHSSVPAAVVDNVDDPQLSATVTAGVAGVDLGAAVPLPDALVQPFTVWVTVYVPAVVTVMLDVEAPVLHSSVPAAVVDKVEVPLQLLTTVTAGAEGIVLGAAVPLPDALVQPLTVWVTVYVPALVTVMLEVAAPVLHSSVPLAVVDNVEDPQLSTTFTAGAAGVDLGAAVPLPDALVQPFTVWVTV